MNCPKCGFPNYYESPFSHRDGEGDCGNVACDNYSEDHATKVLEYAVGEVTSDWGVKTEPEDPGGMTTKLGWGSPIRSYTQLQREAPAPLPSAARLSRSLARGPLTGTRWTADELASYVQAFPASGLASLSVLGPSVQPGSWLVREDYADGSFWTRRLDRDLLPPTQETADSRRSRGSSTPSTREEGPQSRREKRRHVLELVARGSLGLEQALRQLFSEDDLE